MHETWVYGYDPLTSPELREWVSHAFQATSRPSRDLHACYVLCLVGPRRNQVHEIHGDWQTGNAEEYWTQVRELDNTLDQHYLVKTQQNLSFFKITLDLIKPEID